MHARGLSYLSSRTLPDVSNTTRCVAQHQPSMLVSMTYDVSIVAVNARRAGDPCGTAVPSYSCSDPKHQTDRPSPQGWLHHSLSVTLQLSTLACSIANGSSTQCTSAAVSQGDRQKNIRRKVAAARPKATGPMVARVTERRVPWLLIRSNTSRLLLLRAAMADGGDLCSEDFQDFSLYSDWSDEQLIQLAIERSLSERQARAASPPVTQRRSPQPPAPNQTVAHYSSPNPPMEKPPDPDTFDGVVSCFVTGSGKRMVAYRRHDGSLVHVAPEPLEVEEPLLQAVRLGDAETVKQLVTRAGTNPLLPDKPGWLAIHQAAFYDRGRCLEVLLAAQPGMVNQQTERGETALLIATSRENLSPAELLLEHGANTDISNHERESPLYKACERSNGALVAALLNHGASVNAQCHFGWTALQEAASRNNVEICEMLLKAGAKLNLPNIYGITPTFTAAQSGQVAALRCLLKHGADVNTEAADGATALYEAAKNGHEAVVELLLSQSADANRPGKTGLLPIHVAAQRGSDTIVSMLIPRTSKARVRRTGISPLHLAVERNRDQVLEVLIRAGFDVNAQLSEERSKLYEDRRSTALYFSVLNNNVDATRALLAAGADPNLDVLRPLMVAARQGCIRTVTLLVEHGADVNAEIPTHPTTFPAVYMFSMKYLPLFKYLLDNGGRARPCFDCAYGSAPHPPIGTSRSPGGSDARDRGRKGVQFCEMISAPSICRWSGPIIDVLLDYVGHVTLCSRLQEHLDSYPDWGVIKDKATPPRPLLQLCRLRILGRVQRRHLHRLPLPARLISFLQHQEGADVL
ncbi:ankyrin repeat and SOCS box protein 2-like [Synchiropus splendidus]|uniref:ankyrin repeat and SOCS box protein 2-like n=1 Tax=Synchiropus splendidus TaxID=270530 RepID=UPI00237D9F3A|nr:ankyrin repeat and SOCS box protein 2-like [Synchiropus splendidus]